MDKWTHRFENHAIFTTLKTVLNNQRELRKIKDLSPQAIQTINRIKQIRLRISNILKTLDPVLVPLPPLNDINNHITNLNNEITEFISDKDEAHLTNADTHLDATLLQLPLLLPPSRPEDFRDIGGAVTALRRTLGQHSWRIAEEVKNLTTQIENTKKKSDETESKAETLSSDIEQKTIDFNNTIESIKGKFEEHLRSLTEQTQASESKRQEQFTQAELDRNNQANTAEQGRTSQFEAQSNNLKNEFDTNEKWQQELFNKTVEKLETTVNENVQALQDEHERHTKDMKAKAASYLNELSTHKNKAKELVGIIATTGMSGGYKDAARKADIVATIWNVITVSSMLGLIYFAIRAFGLTQEIIFTWPLFMGRLYVSLTFAVLAAYAATQAQKYQNQSVLQYFFCKV